MPILGCGSAPFRGNFKPSTVKSVIEGYPSVYTYTLQSAFKYDYNIREVTKAVDLLNETNTKEPVQVDEERLMPIIEKIEKEYQEQVKLLEPFINGISPYIPSRRKRKLHIGLFGYSRNVAGLKLPRAITFCAALYSFGLPPEILGLNALNGNEIDYVREVYVNFDNDLRDSMMFLNESNLGIFPNEIAKAVDEVKKVADFDVDEKHKKITSIILEEYKRKDSKILSENIMRAGFVRGFLG